MTSSTDLSSAFLIPEVTPAEAEMLAQTELRRLLALLESLGPEELAETDGVHRVEHPRHDCPPGGSICQRNRIPGAHPSVQRLR